MKILHYIPTLNRQDGGTSMYIQQLAAVLGQLTELHLVAHPSANELPIQGAQVHYLTLSYNYWRVRNEYLSILQSVQPDVVHVNCCWHPYFAYAVIWARNAGYKVVLTPHGMLEPWIMQRNYWSRKLPSLLLYQRKAVRMANLLHATAEAERDHLKELQWNTHIEVIPNGIRIEDIQLKETWTLSRKILFLSRIHPKKGIDQLIRALSVLPDTFSLEIAGEGEASFIQELKQLASDEGVAHRVKWLGGVYDTLKWTTIQEADIMVLPTHSENFGIVVAEALASGTPVITTHGTPWQSLNEEHCGWWIPYGAEPLRRALTEYASCTADQLREMGLNGRRLVEKNFSTQTIAKRFVEMYQRL